ncbi:MAG TPA: hypothetical protein VF602_07590 [Pedobacter sp.]|jgi:hypothetical protein
MDYNIKQMDKKELQIPIFALYNFQSLEDILLTIDDADFLKKSYSLQERMNLYDALKWAKDNPKYDFKSIMADAPIPHKLKVSNADIYKYLLNFKIFMESEEYKILSE